MSKAIIRIILLVMVSLALTSLTYFIPKSSESVPCGPSGYGPMAELTTKRLYDRGYPSAFYYDSVGDCDGSDLNPNTVRGRLDSYYFTNDFLFWAAITTTISLITLLSTRVWKLK